MADGLGAITFAELHLLPRVVFAIGAAIFVAAIINQSVGLGTVGLGVIFTAVSYNLFFDFFINRNLPVSEDPIKHRRERVALLVNGFLSLSLASYFFYATARWHACSTLPFPFRHFL
jgi:hypothetical protein